MALRTHNLPSEVLKNDFCEVDDVMFQRPCEMPREIIFFITGIEKSYFMKSLK
jgi:hypothetical protein